MKLKQTKESSNSEIVRRFCDHCDWAHQCWLLRIHLYDKNPEENLLRHSHHVYFFNRLAQILQEFWLNEVAKLHDPKTQKGFSNLSIDYIFELYEWEAPVRERLSDLIQQMEVFASHAKEARNKLTAHKDLDTIMSDRTLGEFEEGEDEDYFKILHEYADIVKTQVTGERFLFDDLTPNDVRTFMSTFSRGVLGADGRRT